MVGSIDFLKDGAIDFSVDGSRVRSGLLVGDVEGNVVGMLHVIDCIALECLLFPICMS